MNSFEFTPVLLASASPRRRELLTQLGVPHEVLAVDVDETALAGETAQQLVTRLALQKALAGRRRDVARPVLGSDTVVVVDGVVFGKPADRSDAVRMLAALSGRTHRVMTAVALVCGADQVAQALSDTAVTMRRIAPAEAADYWDTGEPQGKAGGYAIQGRGALFIEHISGSYSGVMGLPLYETAQLLHTLQQRGGNR
jgi:nucleoside triphosphate pyrophosphatase